MKEQGSEALLLFHPAVAQNGANSSETTRDDRAGIEPKVATAPLGSIGLLNLLSYRSQEKETGPHAARFPTANPRIGTHDSDSSITRRRALSRGGGEEFKCTSYGTNTPSSGLVF